MPNPPNVPHGTLLVLTCVDGALRDGAAASCGASHAAVAALSQRGVPIVLVSHHNAGDLLAIQQELALRQPFIAGNGAALHVPAGYFSAAGDATSADTGWHVVEFTPPSLGRAIDVLKTMFRRREPRLLLIGIGVDRDDCALLRHVDVPIVVRQSDVAGSDLRLLVPDAYVTTATGVSGWAEAMLGKN